MRVLVCGGHGYDDWDTLKAALDDAKPTSIIHGGAAGADYLAGLYAQMNGIEEVRYPADWRKHASDAPLLRNQAMIDEGRPDLVLVFPGCMSADDLIRRARLAHVTVVEICWTAQEIDDPTTAALVAG